MESTGQSGLGVGQGAALFLGVLLGPGVLALPHLAVVAAGPASLVAWAALVVLSVPVAATFAALGARFPGGGGVSAAAGRVFGAPAAAVVGWWFYASVPVGVPAGALIGGEYVAASLGAGRGTGLAVAGVLLVAAFAANRAGLRTSGRIQLVLGALLVVLLAVAVAAAAPRVRAGEFTPFAPYGWGGVADAAGVLFLAFVGWEAAIHLSAEFTDPRRDVPRATALTLAVAAVLYLGLAVVTVGALGGRAAGSPVPLTLLLEYGIGGAARPVTAVAAVLLSFGAINTYLAAGVRLGAALAGQGPLPRAVAGGHRGLGVLAVATAGSAMVVAAAGVGVGALLRVTTACLAAVTFAGVAAATRLLGGGRRAVAGAAAVLVVPLLVACGGFLVAPVLIAVAVLVVRRRSWTRLTNRIVSC